MEIKQQVWDAVQALGQKLGVASEHLYTVLVRQALVNSVTELLGLLVAWAFVLSFILCGFRFLKFCENNNKYEPSGCLLFFIPAAIIGICSTVATFGCIGDIVTGFVNPEFWAIDHILNLIRKN